MKNNITCEKIFYILLTFLLTTIELLKAVVFTFT